MATSPSSHEEHPAWWLRLCQEYEQDPNDPDAFCTIPPNELAVLIDKAKQDG